jgi:preprotein translocase subunit YajC
LVPLLIVVALFAVMVIVPQRRRSRDAQTMRSSLAPGADVMTTAGLYGRVDAIDSEHGTVDLEVSDGVIVRFATQAIARVINADQHDPIADHDDSADPVSADDAEEKAPDTPEELTGSTNPDSNIADNRSPQPDGQAGAEGETKSDNRTNRGTDSST